MNMSMYVHAYTYSRVGTVTTTFGRELYKKWAVQAHTHTHYQRVKEYVNTSHTTRAAHPLRTPT